jgi:hypothetical protein
MIFCTHAATVYFMLEKLYFVIHASICMTCIPVPYTYVQSHHMMSQNRTVGC